MTEAEMTAAALAASQRPEPYPSRILCGRVALNVYPGVFEKVPGCVAAAVYRVPERGGDTLWLITVYKSSAGVQWLSALLGDV